MKNISQYVMYALNAIGIVVFIMALGVDAELPDTYEKAGPIIYTVYAILAATIFFALAAAVNSSIIKPETLKGAAIGIGSLGAVLIISYIMATDMVPEAYSSTLTASTSKMSGASLYAFYILFSLAIVSIIVTEVMNMVKK